METPFYMVSEPREGLAICTQSKGSTFISLLF